MELNLHALVVDSYDMPQSVINRDPEILGGTPVFAGTRVPVRILLEHFEAGEGLDDFLEDFPSVSKEQAIELLDLVIRNLSNIDDEAAA
jgi:uncharacterized protein (DUF433 family)